MNYEFLGQCILWAGWCLLALFAKNYFLAGVACGICIYSCYNAIKNYRGTK